MQPKFARLALAIAALVACAAAHPLAAQQPPPLGPPFEPRPLVPQLEPRPSEGPTPDSQWQVQRSGDAARPTAALFGSLQGSDAAIEVIVGQARLLTTKQPVATQRGTAVVAVGDPSVVDFEVLPNPRMLRLVGKRPGVTDLSVITAEGQAYTFEVRVIYDVGLLTAQLRRAFPGTEIKVTQLSGALLLEGQARTMLQAAAIETALEAYVQSLAPSQAGVSPAASVPAVRPAGYGGAPAAAPNAPPPMSNQPAGTPPPTGPVPTGPSPLAPTPAEQYLAEVEAGPRAAAGIVPPLQIINLMQVPGVKQVLLQVKIGELNRTALREIGADWLFQWGEHGNTIGTRMIGASTNVVTQDSASLLRLLNLGTHTTSFGVFPSGSVAILLRALRDNSVLNVLAEPNLIALSGQQASFLAGGQFPVPVPQSGGGITNNITIQFKNFGVQLSFVPYVLDDQTIRLQVAPEVSSIDFSLGTTFVQGGTPVPGLNTRRVETTVELKQGSTLALAGLLQVDLDARTQRIPGLGDLPYLGPLFSNTTHKRAEKELLVLVTPYLIQPMAPDQVPPVPGDEVQDPNDKEFYFLNRIEGKTGTGFRATTAWDNVWSRAERIELEQKYLQGAAGYSP
jgi:pilus assembly protein CpaC